ncbi:phosphoribosylglycinamide formyltransferase [Gorillibacterium massiliense]|uniref:phosphoribosylglycinamide formyltransferase n=1 Tax=Gorillibacterium massiliense TaxID=1280390 RepID=UPI0004B78081|nr:phosphoribosylglycinamide formyltransferase [Gorillibacterium massiliense]
MTVKPYRIAVFASGSGSNFQALAEAAASGKLDAEIALLVCDKPQAPVVEKAQRLGIPVFAFRPKDYPDKAAYEGEIVGKLDELGVDLVVLAGYMRIISSVLLTPYEGRIINVHPSLLPSFPGLDAIGQALAYGVKVTGITVHFVDGGMDTGPIIAQETLRILPEDTAETLAARIHPIEHKLYAEVVQGIREGRISLTVK